MATAPAHPFPLRPLHHQRVLHDAISRTTHKDSVIHALVNSLGQTWKNVLMFWQGRCPKFRKLVHLACHASAGLVAVSDGISLFVFSLKNEQWLDLNFAHTVTSDAVLCMEWAGRDSSTLIFGVPEGISILRFDSRESISPTHLAHPQGRSVSQIAVAPHGRLVATLSRGDSFILVWDIILGTSTSVYCLQAAFDSDLSWSPSGNHIIIGQSSGDVVLIETSTWEHSVCCQVQQQLVKPVRSKQPVRPTLLTCWASGSLCLISGQVVLSGGVGAPASVGDSDDVAPALVPAVYACAVDAEEADPRPDLLSIAPVPLSLAASPPLAEILRGARLRHMSMDPTGQFLAATFSRCRATTRATGTSGNSDDNSGSTSDRPGASFSSSGNEAQGQRQNLHQPLMKDEEDEKEEVLPFVAVYLCRSTPSLSFALVRTVEYPGTSGGNHNRGGNDNDNDNDPDSAEPTTAPVPTSFTLWQPQLSSQSGAGLELGLGLGSTNVRGGRDRDPYSGTFSQQQQLGLSSSGAAATAGDRTTVLSIAWSNCTLTNTRL